MSNTLFINCLPFLKNHKPEHIVAHIADQPGAIWLDSAAPGHEDNHFSIIGWQPAHWLEVQEGTVYCDGVPQPETDPFQQLQHWLDHYQPDLPVITDDMPALPFKGGYLGALSYDLGRLLERLPQHAQADIALPQMAGGIYLTALLYDTRTQQWYLLSPQTHWQTVSEQVQQWANTPAPARQTLTLTAPWQSNMTRAQYLQQFNRIQAYLQAGDCYQINLTQRFSASCTGDPFTGYCQLRNKNAAPFSAYIKLAEGALLSFSPERFIAVTDGHISTKPIKGTRPRDADPEQDARQRQALAEASKDRAENLMIVDLLRNDLGKVAAPGTVTVPSLFAIESFPAVHHLVSTVTAELASNETAVSLLKAAFPGGSITGAPKVRAMEIIDELEPHRRSFYCGSIGYLSLDGAMDTNIAIRTIIHHAQQVHCWGGGGIVADSIGPDEYQETLDKVSRILPELATSYDPLQH